MLTVFATIWMLRQITLVNDALSVIEEALQDYNVTDIVFSKLATPKQPHDDIVIINIGDLNNDALAGEIMTILEFGPKVVAINALMKEWEGENNEMLAEVLNMAPNLVLVAYPDSLSEGKDGKYRCHSLTYSDPMFDGKGHAAFGKMSVEDARQFNTWRYVLKEATLPDGSIFPSFAAKVAHLYDSSLYRTFIDRESTHEIINFSGNLNQFTVLDKENVFNRNFDPDIIKDKIVLFGYLGEEYTAGYWEGDKFYTPLNDDQVGRSFPDMFGTVVQANILSMILTKDYIDEIPLKYSIIAGILLCYFNVALFVYINRHRRMGLWFDLITKVIQLIEVVILVFLVLSLFANFNIKLDLTLAIFTVLLVGDITEIYLSLVVGAYYKAKSSYKKRGRGRQRDRE